MKLETVVGEEGLLVRLGGEVDHHRAPLIRGEIDRLLKETEPARLTLDFSQTDFMDSSGLGLILGRKERCDERGIPLVLCNPTDPILRMLRLSGLDRAIPIEYV